MTVTFTMRIGYLLGIIILLLSCKEAPIVVPPPPEEEVEVDHVPPIIKWVFLYSDNNTDGWLIKPDSRGNYKGMLEYP